MNVLVILGHPDEGSFSHAIAQVVIGTLRSKGHRVVFHDLYRERFAAALPKAEISDCAALPPVIRRHCRELREADGIVVIHPNWWGQPPAVLKGWIDRVVRAGVAYRFLEGDGGEGVPVGLLKARTAVVFNTSNTTAKREKNAFGDPLETLWRNCIFDLCGVKKFHRRMFRVVVTSTPKQRQAWLREAATLVVRCFGSG